MCKKEIMYITRPRSAYRKFPGSLSVKPEPDATYSGHLVISDEESEAMDSYCCGLWKSDRIKKLPFPQDRILKIVHSSSHEEASVTKVWLVPVLDMPLSSNRYYVIKAKGRCKGYVRCSFRLLVLIHSLFRVLSCFEVIDAESLLIL